MIKYENCDIAVIGAGAAGLSAGRVCAESGLSCVVIDRENHPGGVLRQCIHNGFGLHYFKEELTGPEYAEKLFERAKESGVVLKTDSTVEKIDGKGSRKELLLYSKDAGVTILSAKAVILAMGCRERCRGSIGTPGDRLAGVFTAGLAQRFLNMEGMLPGKTAVIVGSGDIGLIMARRLTWSGVKVKAVAEIMPNPSGLSRNIAQCLEDFNIPLYLSTRVTGIHGKNRVESVTLAPVEADGKTDLSRERRIECDTVLFSVGLIPENELSVQCGVKLNPVTRSALINSHLMTNIPGIFACGNVLHVHDLADYVSEESERCAENAVLYVKNGLRSGGEIQSVPNSNIRYVVPNACIPGEAIRFYMRPSTLCRKGILHVTGKNFQTDIPLRHVKPAEMIRAEFPAGKTAALEGEKLSFDLEILEK